jgi:hypothetical protein
MQQNGLTVHTLSPELQQAWETRSRDSYPVLLDGVVPPALVARAESLREEYRSRRASAD